MRYEMKYLLISVAILFLALFLLAPLLLVFSEAFDNGVRAYFAALVSPDALHAIYLTGLCRGGCRADGTLSVWPPPGRLRNSSSRQEPLDHVDRLAVFHLTSHRRAVVRDSLQSHARLLRSLAGEHGIRIIFAVPGIIVSRCS